MSSTRHPETINDMKELSTAELFLIKSLRNMEDPIELVKACSKIESSTIKNTLLFVAAEKMVAN